jgi:CSLREA domain-containing protein
MSCFRVSLLWTLGLAIGSVSAAQAVTFTVDSAADLVDAVPGDGVCAAADGTCTLRAAVMEANALPGADTIAFTPALNGIPIILNIPCDPGGCSIDVATNGDLDVIDELTVAGNGAANTVIQGGPTLAAAVDRVFDASARLTLSGVTIRFGNESESYGRGGGIRSTAALTISDSVIADNQALNANIGVGGGIASSAELALTRVTIRNNTASNGGGVFWDPLKPVLLTVAESTFDHNHAVGAGASGTGGGLFTDYYSAGPSGLVTDSTFSGNTASQDGCAILWQREGTLRLDSATIADNCVAGPAAAVVVASYGYSSTASSAEVVLKNTIVSSAAGLDNCRVDASWGPPRGFTSEGYNLASDVSCPLAQPGDVQGTDPVLGPLANNGGPTSTHLPLAGSPAIDRGTPTECPPIDQRGLGRPANGGGGPVCDKGSVEVGAGPPPPPPVTASIGGVVWDDADASGTQNGGEPGLIGVQVCLFPTVPSLCTTTTVGGAYQLSNLAPGTYDVYIRLPLDRVSTTPRSVHLSVAAGPAARVDFGTLIPPPQPAQLSVNAAWHGSTLPVMLTDRPLHLVATPGCVAATVTATLSAAGASRTQALTPAGGGTWETTFAPPFHSGAIYTATIDVSCADGTTQQFVGSLQFVDPSGTVRDGCTGRRLGGATVSLLKNEPYGSASYVMPDPGEHVPTDNPELTTADGVFAWDVVPGRWKVVASKAGYGSVTVGPFDVPPPATGLDITLVPTIGCNTPPVATDDAYTTDQGATLTVPAPGALGNDTDVDGNPLTAILVTNAANGSVALAADGSFTYTPNASFFGIDHFTYKASDGRDDSNVATVTITVRKVNRPPVAKDDAYTTTRNRAFFIAPPGVLANDSDPEGSSLTAKLVRGAAHGVVLLSANGSFVYLPKRGFVGTDTFTYQASDGVNTSNLATVTINVVRKKEHDKDDGDDRDEHDHEHGDREDRGRR